jgi:ATP-binding cassette subfamily C (CFTR/MRP) protein 1
MSNNNGTVMACTINDNQYFGPVACSRCYGGFDFTLYFEELVLTIIPCVVIAFVVVPFRAGQLQRESQKVWLSGVYHIKAV